MGVVLQLASLKRYLGVSHTTDHDVLLNELIEDVESEFQSYTRTALIVAARTELLHGGTAELQVSYPPIALDSLVLTDMSDNTVVPAEDYVVDHRAGIIRTAGGHDWWGHYTPSESHERWRAVYDGGLPADMDWTVRIERELRRSFRDYAAHLFEVRSPGASKISEGGGLTLDIDEEHGLPKRVRSVWDKYVLDLVF